MDEGNFCCMDFYSQVWTHAEYATIFNLSLLWNNFSFIQGLI